MYLCYGGDDTKADIAGLPERLKNMRVQAGLTLKEVGDIISISDSAVHNWEKGYRQPDLEMLGALCDVYGCTAGYLLGTEQDGDMRLSAEEAGIVTACIKAGFREALDEAECLGGIDAVRTLVHAYDKCCAIAKDAGQTAGNDEIDKAIAV